MFHFGLYSRKSKWTAYHKGAGGFNNNLTARHFVARYKRLLMRYDFKVVTENAVYKDHTTVLTATDTGNALKKALDD